MKHRIFSASVVLLITVLLLGAIGCSNALPLSVQRSFETMREHADEQTILITEPSFDDNPVFEEPAEVPVYEPQHIVCPQCGGTGMFYNPCLYFDGTTMQGGYTACPQCGGSGWLH